MCRLETVDPMKMTMFALVCLSALLCVQGVTTQCPSGHFFNRRMELCIRCAECPRNEIIRRTCTKHKDTLCGPFYEWHEKKSSVSENSSHHKDLGGGGVREEEKFEEKAFEKVQPILDLVDEPVSPTDSRPFHMISTDGENYWKIVSFCLMAILAVVLLVCAAFCVLKLSRRKRKDYDDPVYLRTRIFSRDRLSTSDYVRSLSDMDIELGPLHDLRKKRLHRLFKSGKAVEYRDEVFDASDESIYKSVNNGKFRLPAIPEELFEREMASKVERAMSKLSQCNTTIAEKLSQCHEENEECGCEGACTCAQESSSVCLESETCA